ncbi:MAG: M48 family metallopeptidase [Pseudomonadota bacterium]
MVYLIYSLTDIIIGEVNVKNLKRYKHKIPEDFDQFIDENDLIKIEQYAVDKTRVSSLESIFAKILFMVIILYGLMPWLTEILGQFNFVLAGLIFFAVPGLLGAISGLPFDYYHIFVIEKRYGFNTRTFKIWLSDLFKSLLITVILGTFLLTLLLLMINFFGSMWWILAWIVFFLFQLLMTVLYPTVIAPMFNKFTPIQNEQLADKIRSLSTREGMIIKGLFQMDAKRRTRHTNAYITGLGKAKRIVFYDTLLEGHKEDEILAVLAHEIGHLKGNHIKKQILIMGFVFFILFFLASRMITWETMYHSFGFARMPAHAGLFLVAVIWEPIGYFLSPLAMAISRRFEREADRYSVMIMKTSEPLITALKKMVKDNLSNLRPHPLYIWFHYSHPPILKRIETLKKSPFS